MSELIIPEHSFAVNRGANREIAFESSAMGRVPTSLVEVVKQAGPLKRRHRCVGTPACRTRRTCPNRTCRPLLARIQSP